MAASLGVSEGMAGQAVTATALVALVTGLLITPATKSIDRRWVLMFFSVLQIISSLLVAFAPNLHVLLMGRLLLGIAIGGFWAMSTATTMRLVPADKVPKALAVIFSSVSIATVVAAPLGSYLGSLIGWMIRSLVLSDTAVPQRQHSGAEHGHCGSSGSCRP